MPRLARWMQRLRTDRKAATTVEYGLILAFVVLAIMAAVTAVADKTSGMWSQIDHRVDESM